MRATLPLTRPVHFRLSAEDYARYEQGAAQAGVHLSEYIRARLQHTESVADELARLRFAVLDHAQTSGRDETIADTSFVLCMESLLLLRALVSPAQLRTIHAEIERLGLQPWTPAIFATHTSSATADKS